MINRNILTKIIAALHDTPVIFLSGSRQTGKSTIAKELIAKGLLDQYVTLDNITILEAAKFDPRAFVRQYAGKKLVIDEIQRAPELLLAIKEIVDEKRVPGNFFLTGSANVMLLPKVAESLAGRMQIINLWPLSIQEILGGSKSRIDQLFSGGLQKSDNQFIKHNIFSNILTGGYPEATVRYDLVRREDWFDSYLNAIVQRDIREIANIEDLTLLPKLLNLIATRSATLVNYSELARSSRIPETSLKRYISLLESVFLVHKIPAWSQNLSKRLVKSPKLILNDTGLMSFLLGLNQTELDKDVNLKGQLFEVFVIIEILKQMTWSSTRASAYHYRTQNRQEIDLILENRRGEVIAIEIKAKTTIKQKDFVTMSDLSNEIGDKFLGGYIVYLGNDILSFGEKLFLIPANLVLC